MCVGIGYGVFCPLQDEQLAEASSRQIVDALLPTVAQTAAGLGCVMLLSQRLRRHVNFISTITPTMPHSFLVASRGYSVLDPMQYGELMIFLAGQIDDFCHEKIEPPLE